jgi:hypothetical protein
MKMEIGWENVLGFKHAPTNDVKGESQHFSCLTLKVGIS